MLEDIAYLNLKKFKRALVGLSFFGVVNLREEEAERRLIKNGVVKNYNEARQLLSDIPLNQAIRYSRFGDFILERVSEGYRVRIFVISELMQGF